MKKGLLKHLLLIILFGSFTTNLSAQTQQYHRIEAKISNQQFQELMKEGLEIDHYQYSKGLLSAEVSDDDIILMNKKNIPIKYIIRDIANNITAFNAIIDKNAANQPIPNAVTVPTPANFGTGGTYGPAGGVTRHFTFQEMQNELDDMRALYPGLITVKSSIGTTEQGRPLIMVKISDNPELDENEPELFLTAVHHAREPISMTQLLFFMWYVLENYNSNKEIKTLLNSSEIYIMPCVNPDGYVYNATNNPAGGGMWRKNRHTNGNGTFGVDNNRNYSYLWGGNGSSGTPGSDTYRGTAPFSELENQAIRNFCNSRQFVTEFNNHSYGNYCIYPFSGVAVNNNPERPLFIQLSVFLTEDNGFLHGNCQETLNYIADGEANDWGYGEQTTKGKMYGFTPEIGNSSDGFYPAASRILPLCNSMIVMNMNLLKVSTKYGLVTTTPPAFVSGSSGTIPFSLKNYSIYPATYTITLSSASSYITSIDAPKIISSSTLLQTINNQFNFTIDPNTPHGSNIDFVISTDNGYHTRDDSFTVQYQCVAPTGTSTSGVTTSSANVSWGSISGVTDYYLSSKLASSGSWGAEVLVTGTSSSLTGLNSGTAYNWRVRTSICSNYSATQSFTTLSVCNTPAPVASAITKTGFTLTWPVIAGAISYTVQTRLQGTSTWTSSNVSTNSKVVTGLSPNRVYEFQVSTNCSSDSSLFSAIQTVTTLAYCSSNGTNNNNEWIDHIKLGSITRISGIEPGGYINTGLSTNLARNKSHTLTFSAGFSSTVYKEFWDVFIDYNNDGDFSDGNEHEVSVNKTGAGNYTVNISVPKNSPLVSTRMRVKMSRTNSDDPCGVFNNGEVEDYNINITTAAEEEELLTSRTSLDIGVKKNTNAADVLINTIYPNPFTDKVYIRLSKQNGKQVHITLLNGLGIAVYKQTLAIAVSDHTINTAHLPAGIYLLVIENGETRKTIKLVK